VPARSIRAATIASRSLRERAAITAPSATSAADWIRAFCSSLSRDRSGGSRLKSCWSWREMLCPRMIRAQGSVISAVTSGARSRSASSNLPIRSRARPRAEAGGSCDSASGCSRRKSSIADQFSAAESDSISAVIASRSSGASRWAFLANSTASAGLPRISAAIAAFVRAFGSPGRS